ncbi:MAG: hypothetical protein RL527_378 [Planctomycetota bacterium]|jgi:hypothetical protein
MMRSIPIVLLLVASCATVPEPAPLVTTAITKQLPGPWTVVDGGTAFFKAEAVLFSADGRIRITREGKLRRGTWAMVDGMLEVKGVEQTTRFEVTPTADGLLLRPLAERQGAWRRTEAEVTLRGARVLPTAG